MIRFSLICLVCLAAWSDPVSSAAEDRYGPEDVFASIDGDPIYLGELNLILTERLRVRDLDEIPSEVKRATAALVVRRHLALKSLQDQGGAALEAMVQRQIEATGREAKRLGSSFQKQAELRLANERALEADIAWRTAWGEYLKRTLTDKNLRIYFEQNRARYGGGRWKVSQIFVDMDPKDAESVAVATSRMGELAEELNQATEVASAFRDAAENHSDAGSAESGGLVGWVEKDGDLPTAVMNAVRSAKIGKVSEPIASPMGMHLILVHEFEPGKLQFEGLTDQSQLRRDATNALFDRLIKKQASAKVVWHIAGLQPPPSVPIIPR